MEDDKLVVFTLLFLTHRAEHYPFTLKIYAKCTNQMHLKMYRSRQSLSVYLLVVMQLHVFFIWYFTNCSYFSWVQETLLC